MWKERVHKRKCIENIVIIMSEELLEALLLLNRYNSS